MNALLNLPHEIWHGWICPQLALLDLWRLDSATLNHSLRAGLLSAFEDVEVRGEEIVFPVMSRWVMNKKIKMFIKGTATS